MSEMTKAELVARVEELESDLCELESALLALEPRLGAKVAAPAKLGRKEQVLACFDGGGLWSIAELAAAVGITDRNVSSQLSYLRADGWQFARLGSGAGKLKLIGRAE